MTADKTKDSGCGLCWRRSTRTELLVLLFILALGAVLRLYHLGTQSLWFDEAASVVHAGGSPARIVAAVSRAEGSPPLYFLLLRGAMAAGRSEAVVRSLSVVAGIVALPLIYLLARALYGPATGLSAAALLAISPFALYHSQEARPYALLLLLSLASCYALLLAVAQPRRGRWTVYGVVTLAAMYTHYFTFFLLLAQAVVILSSADYRKQALRPWLVCQGVMAAAFVPWIPYLLAQLRWQGGGGGQNWAPNVGLLLLPYTFFQFSLGYSAVDIRSFSDLAPHAALLMIGGAAFGIPLAVSLADSRRHAQAARWTWLPLLTAMGAAFLLHLKLRSYQPVYLAGVMPLYLIVLASGLRRPWLAPAAVMAAGLCVFSLHNYYTKPEFAKEDWRAAARYVQAAARPMDIIAFHKSWPRAAFDYYYRGRAAEYALPDDALPSGSPALQQARRVLSGGSAVWLVLAHNYDTGSHYPDLLGKWFGRGRSREFRTCRPITVYRFLPTEGEK